MFENIERVIRNCGILTIEEALYGSSLYAGFDFYIQLNNATDTEDATVVYTGSEVSELIQRATSPGDVIAMDALEKLLNFSKQSEAFLFAEAGTMEELMMKLEVKAARFNQLTVDEQHKQLLDFVATAYGRDE